MTRRLPLMAALCALMTAPALAEETVFPSELRAHVVLPALTLIAPPSDAPVDAWISGKFAAGPNRVDRPMSVEGNTGRLHGGRSTGIRYPFIGQPVQGFSGFAMDFGPEGSVYALTDNGFGSKVNSPDALLFFHRVIPEFDTGNLDIVETVFLRDPDHIIPFRIAHEGTQARYLTGADFDLESIQVVDGKVWIGEEFGPFLLSATLDGVITGLHPTMLDGEELKSPDHPTLRVPAAAGSDFTVPRSGGYEGMALHPATGRLWAMLEKPLLDESGETGPRVLEVMEFDPLFERWTGETFRFPLAEGATAIGDFNFIDDTHALVIERDNGEGDPSLACADPEQPQADCFPRPANLKRVVLIDTSDVDENGLVRRVGHVDLMDIDDPHGIARLQTDAKRDLTGKFTLPFFTIEDVMRYDDNHILVGTDNNLPFSSGRHLDAAMNNEFVLLYVPELLHAELPDEERMIEDEPEAAPGMDDSEEGDEAEDTSAQ